ncbi:hypothetical protein L6452_30704 [Arctium lappa]|uniref:Uncharacterized protein n=1 Tax=Arctium lappa TaxID=4217 RepID=A0ACB8ZIW9_ARCLA|nr:hypothetical protein L6452_30704 [Arctium lappa]
MARRPAMTTLSIARSMGKDQHQYPRPESHSRSTASAQGGDTGSITTGEVTTKPRDRGLATAGGDWLAEVARKRDDRLQPLGTEDDLPQREREGGDRWEASRRWRQQPQVVIGGQPQAGPRTTIANPGLHRFFNRTQVTSSKQSISK